MLLSIPSVLSSHTAHVWCKHIIFCKAVEVYVALCGYETQIEQKWEMCVYIYVWRVVHSNTSGTLVATLHPLESQQCLLFLKEQQKKKAVYDSSWWSEGRQFFVWVCVCNPQRDLCIPVCMFLHRPMAHFVTSLYSVTCAFEVEWQRSDPFPQHHPSGMLGTRGVCLTRF